MYVFVFTLIFVLGYVSVYKNIIIHIYYKYAYIIKQKKIPVHMCKKVCNEKMKLLRAIGRVKFNAKVNSNERVQ